ncbi:hypothetical protein C8R43DRAFT_976425 [Mycena crocata]|nr:hypothetical protein C8R43DRAFT_976425 [Mycena crocata]
MATPYSQPPWVQAQVQAGAFSDSLCHISAFFVAIQVGRSLWSRYETSLLLPPLITPHPSWTIAECYCHSLLNHHCLDTYHSRSLQCPFISSTMKDQNIPTNTSIPRSANIGGRFRPLSLPVHLDYRNSTKRRPAAPVEAVQRQLVASTKQVVSGGFQISSIPRILRPGGARAAILSKSAQRPPPYHPKQNESRCCQMLIHGLFVAFEDDFVDSGVPRSEDLRADGGKEFTHFISLSTRHKTQIKQSVDRNSGAKRLRLKLPRLYSPAPPTQEELEEKVRAASAEAAKHGTVLTQDDYYDIVFDEGEGSRYTGLEALQLLAARDFLYGSGLSADSNTVRVLVTTPRDHRTDAIAAVMGYLSLVLGYRVAKVLKTQDNHPKVLGVWKDTISEECAAYIEDVCHL